jgi:D-glycero-alpha-D-manno-heptose-7-phosphate kinase
MTEFEQHVVVVFTGITRRAGDVVAKQLQRIDDNTCQLHELRRLVDDGWDILTGNRPLQEFGALLHRTWQLKRSLDGSVSLSEIDMMYEQGREAGAWGGKLLGAGGGGFLLFFAPPEVHPALWQTFGNRQLLNVKICAPGAQVIFAES